VTGGCSVGGAIGGVAVGFATDGWGTGDCAIVELSFFTTWVRIKVLGAVPASTQPVSVMGSFAILSFALYAGVCAVIPAVDASKTIPKLMYFIEVTSGHGSAQAAPI
jgi:hypothetical protein